MEPTADAPVRHDELLRGVHLLEPVHEGPFGGDHEGLRFRVALDRREHAGRGADLVRQSDDVLAALGVGDDDGVRVLRHARLHIHAAEHVVRRAGAVVDDDLLLGDLALHPVAEVAVGGEQDLVAVDAPDDAHGVGRRAADVRVRLDLGRGVHVGHDGVVGVALAPVVEGVGGDRVGERAARGEMREEDRLPRVEDLRGLRHEEDAAEDDQILVAALGLEGEAERVAHEVGDSLDLGQLVVVGEDHRVLLVLQAADLRAQRPDLVLVHAGPRLRRDPNRPRRALSRGHRHLPRSAHLARS